MTYELLPHTADLRAILSAPTLAGLYQVAADLVRELLVGDSPVTAGEAWPVDLGDVGDEDERFFRFVRELVVLHDLDGTLPAEVELADVPVVRGERFDAGRHVCFHQLKAVTRHAFDLRQVAAGYEARLVFDL